MKKLQLHTPITINGKAVKELSYDTNAITVGLFVEAEARKLKAVSRNAVGIAVAFEFDYSLHLYLGMMAVVAVNSEIDIADLERITGSDVTRLMKVGRNFITGKLEEPSEQNSSDEPSEITPEPSTLPSQT